MWNKTHLLLLLLRAQRERDIEREGRGRERERERERGERERTGQGQHSIKVTKRVKKINTRKRKNWRRNDGPKRPKRLSKFLQISRRIIERFIVQFTNKNDSVQ